MAVRFSADGEDYTRSVALGAQTQWSVSCWVKVNAGARLQTAWSIDNGTSDWNFLQAGVDTVTYGFRTPGFGRGTRTLTAGVWYWFGVSINGVNGTVKSRADGDMTITTSTWSNGPSSTNHATLRIGESPYGGDWMDGAVAAVKWWSATLSAAELETESLSYAPARTSNLRAWYPFAVAETTDRSGNGQTLSGGTGTSTESGPSISYDAGSFIGWGLPI